jgi:hypothetical protein
MKRREFITALGAAMWPAATRAQRTERRPVVGFLFPASAEVVQPYIAAVRARLAELGYVEGRNYELVIRNAPLPNREAALRLGAELLTLSPAVIVMGSPKPMILAIHQLTSSVPVVFVNLIEDPRRTWPRYEHRASRRQHDWFYAFQRPRHCWEAACAS